MSSVYHRVNTGLLIIVALIGVTIIAMLATGVRGGPLDPTGVPASTPGGIDGRIPISSLPFPITASGSYVVTKDLQFNGGTGIYVDADNVSIDLNGFTLDGQGSAYSAIYSNERSNLSVFNGVIRRWTIGINNDYVSGEETGGLFYRLHIDTNVYGMWVAKGARIDGSIVERSTGAGIVTSGPGATITNSTFSDNQVSIDSTINASQDTLIEANHIEVPPGGIGVEAGDFTTIRRNYFGNPAISGYTTIALGTRNYVVAIENRMKASLTTGTGGAGVPVIPYDVNHALTNISP